MAYIHGGFIERPRLLVPLDAAGVKQGKTVVTGSAASGSLVACCSECNRNRGSRSILSMAGSENSTALGINQKFYSAKHSSSFY